MTTMMTSQPTSAAASRMFSARRLSGFIRGGATRTHDPAATAPDRGPEARAYLSLIAAWTFWTISGGIVAIP